ncbi:MAG: DUF2877 domain-containing protein [Rhodospirillales bacterium]|nr:DUF2877 domain-containing protein [Rhodospirillales bacterium]MDP6803763.1 DUF2877 domain-containing protein [Rhodospirillales bacterium]
MGTDEAPALQVQRTPDGGLFFPVRLIGGAARRALAHGSRATVLTVFRRSFYVDDGDGGLACFGPEAMGAGPLNGLCALTQTIDWRAHGLYAGAPVVVAGGVVTVAERLVFSLEPAREWRPPRIIRRWTPTSVARGLERLVETVLMRLPEEGIGPLIPDLATRRRPRNSAVTALGNAGAGAVCALTGWLAHAASGAPPGSLPHAADPLIGCGPGLTPSGDDFVGGAMIALRAAGRSSAANSLGRWALAKAQEGTGKISRAHLAAAAEGEGADSLHRLVAAVFAGEASQSGIDAIADIGHVSGFDALAGATAVLAHAQPANSPGL